MPNVKIFDWDVVMEDTSGTIEFNAKTISMGDGYEQDISMGINNSKESWTWSIIDDFDIVRDVKDFLSSTKGSESFLWDGPFGEIRVKISNTQLKPMGGDLWKISGTFLQRYR